MYSTYKLNKQDDNMQPWSTLFQGDKLVDEGKYKNNIEELQVLKIKRMIEKSPSLTLIEIINLFDDY